MASLYAVSGGGRFLDWQLQKCCSQNAREWLDLPRRVDLLVFFLFLVQSRVQPAFRALSKMAAFELRYFFRGAW